MLDMEVKPSTYLFGVLFRQIEITVDELGVGVGRLRGDRLLVGWSWLRANGENDRHFNLPIELDPGLIGTRADHFRVDGGGSFRTLRRFGLRLDLDLGGSGDLRGHRW